MVFYRKKLAAKVVVEAVGFEPTSTIVPNSSHSQACLVYYHKPAKIDGSSNQRLPSCCVPLVKSEVTILIFLFLQESPCYLKLGSKVLRNPRNYAARATASKCALLLALTKF